MSEVPGVPREAGSATHMRDTSAAIASLSLLSLDS